MRSEDDLLAERERQLEDQLRGIRRKRAILKSFDGTQIVDKLIAQLQELRGKRRGFIPAMNSVTGA